MRPKLNWDGYDDAVKTINFLVVPIGIEIVRMVASNGFGMTLEQIQDNCRYGKDMVSDWVDDLHREGFLILKVHPRPPGANGIFAGEDTYYQCNWAQIKRVNKAISKL